VSDWPPKKSRISGGVRLESGNVFMCMQHASHDVAACMKLMVFRWLGYTLRSGQCPSQHCPPPRYYVDYIWAMILSFFLAQIRLHDGACDFFSSPFLMIPSHGIRRAVCKSEFCVLSLALLFYGMGWVEASPAGKLSSIQYVVFVVVVMVVARLAEFTAVLVVLLILFKPPSAFTAESASPIVFISTKELIVGALIDNIACMSNSTTASKLSMSSATALNVHKH